MRLKLFLLIGLLTATVQPYRMMAAQAGSTTTTATPSQLGQPLKAQEKTELIRQVTVVYDAFNRGDADTVIKLTHPAIYKLTGGQEAFEKLTRDMMAQINAMGLKFIKRDYGEPTVPYIAGNDIICFIPTDSIISIQGKNLKSISYMVAIRAKGSTEWKFIDGSGVAQHRELLWVLFPALQKDVQTPETKQELLPQQ